ncbi:hypothetical protein SD70_21115 [Gordoniibacillus kamchatkensis]|uniref:Uncharacterized protein n=1 Tax=Gordoniibacillus kamchatkensis TaxID=1590651 RepID=A0ABR5AFZ6_9BACL|nr:hypothetical protein [Paenibacillus sp. VKM B-2647]KIL39297.1 hypothetical protein SD70_21115 [Paenibacillus sp. VKM B-2647]
MNLSEASYRLGQILRRIKEGQELYQLHENLKSRLSHESWDCLNKMRTIMLHYYAFPASLSIIVGNSNRDDLPLPLKNQIDEINKSDETKAFCSLCESFGRSMENFVKELFVPNKIPKSFADFSTPPQLRRAIQDLHVVVSRTGIFKEIIKYMNPSNMELPPLINEFESKIEKQSHHFSKSRRRLLIGLANDEEEMKMLVAFHSFKTSMDLIKQIIFESHLGLMLFLDDGQIQSVKVKKRKRAIHFTARLNHSMLDIMNWYGSIVKFRRGIHDEFGLITKRNIRWNRSEDIKIKIEGYLYPLYDRDILN